jgi:hypothetical protein
MYRLKFLNRFLLGTNALAYLASTLMTMKKTFYDIDTDGISTIKKFTVVIVAIL